MAGGKFAGGDGSALNPFLIEDAHDFNAIRLYSNGYHFQLIKDINMNTPPYNTGTGWQPISHFNSKIDGQGHKVTGLRIWSKGDNVGLFLSSGIDMEITNTHFDDLYFELLTEESGNKLFTFLGINLSGLTFTSYFLNGCSIVGKLKIEAPNANVTARLFSNRVTVGSERTSKSYFRDCYFELENLGSKQIDVFGYFERTNYYWSGNYLYVEKCLLKLKGDFIEYSTGGGYEPSVEITDSFIVDEVGYDTEFSHNTFKVATSEFLSKEENIPMFVESSHLGRQSWYFPGSTHVRMMDYSRNKFLLEADGKIFSYSPEMGFYQVGVTPVLTDMFTLYGMDYIESVPVSIWNQLRQDYGSVEIHCYVEKIPGKSLVTNREKLSFTQALDNKVVMRSVIDFAAHNNDIHKIRIPAIDQQEVPDPIDPPDIEAPVITLNGDNPMNVKAGDEYVEPGATAVDNVDGDLTEQIEITGEVNTATPGEYTITYKVSDLAGNEATEIRAIIVKDEVAPEITLNGNNPINLYVDDEYVEPGATAIDDIDGDLTEQIKITGEADTSTSGKYTVSYKVSDSAGNEATATRTVVVEEKPDTIAPEITLNGDNPVNLTVGDEYIEAGAIAIDDVDGDLTDQIEISGEVDTQTPGEYTVTYTVLDKSGNETSTTRTIIIEEKIEEEQIDNPDETGGQEETPINEDETTESGLN